MTVSSLKAKAGRRLANPPSAARIFSRPASGRLSGGSELNSFPPTAPSNTASEASAASSVSAGSGVPSLTIATPPIRLVSNSKVCPPRSATSCKTATASPVTSGPIPSPAVTRIFSFMPSLFRVKGQRSRIIDRLSINFCFVFRALPCANPIPRQAPGASREFHRAATLSNPDRRYSFCGPPKPRSGNRHAAAHRG